MLFVVYYRMRKMKGKQIMKHLILLINKYVAKNDLYDEILLMGGINNSYTIIMTYSDKMWALINTMWKYTGISAKVVLDKKTNKATISYQGRK